MAAPRVLILRAPGTNCDRETAHAFAVAGGQPESMHVRALVERPEWLRTFQILCIPGGFSYGDDLAAGRVLAVKFRRRLREFLAEFREAGKLILGICNGFQVLIKADLLLAPDARGPLATLTWNASGRYLDRWVRVRVESTTCVFLAGIDRMELPIAHAEGRFVPRDAAVLEGLRAEGRLALRYDSESSRSHVNEDVLPFPDNPNGSIANVAGICDATGRVFGLMPHPERHLDPTHHPRWTREPRGDEGDGMAVFRNAVRYFA
ncbi:MAG: phosphoribosylformylglycinamidine synthase I [Planctomycetes bacterium]|nr:phosphoribosylformylglycinamidine synthase I [Planctomycetota bacterium]